MSCITDVSPKLGQYMLQGWILTDNVCKKCNIVPKMRSPAGRPLLEFCVNCDVDPAQSTLEEREAASSTNSNASTTSPSLSNSRTSTPPTELSITSSPTFEPAIETEETLRRRQQSDEASAEIGNRLLKGWAMLADECPNPSCFGVPLVRPPKPGGGKDPRKECVICRTNYIDEKDAAGFERLVPMVTPEKATRHIAAVDSSSRGLSMMDTAASDMMSSPVLHPSFKYGNLAAHYGPPSRVSKLTYEQSSVVRSATKDALEASAQSLELALHALSRRLTSLASGQANVDPISISQTADAISRTSLALAHVRQFERAPSQ